MSSRCTLAVGEALVLEARGGPPEAEFALFEAGDIELHASEPGSIREAGYRTTVGEARARLAEAGFTPEFADEIAAASRRVVARAYARGAAARCVVERLAAVELIESRAFDPATGTYQGTWLDLGGLASDLALPRATMLLRATYLAAYLAEIPEDEHIFLSTAELSAMRRPGERTFRRVVLDDPRALLEALTAFEPNRMRAPESGTTESGPTRLDIVRWFRQRARQRPDAETRLLALEASLSAREAPTRGPLAETALWQVETKLSRGETVGVSEQLDAIEQRRGRMPGSIYLRARAALISRSEEPHVIAERVSALSTSMAAFHELQLLAAQAWAGAGDARRARAFARDLLENTGADDVLRMQAHEVLETVGAASSAILPHVPPSDPYPIEPQRILSVHPALTSPVADSQNEIATRRRPDADPAEVSIPGPPLAPSGTGDMRSGPAFALVGPSALPRSQTAPIRPSSELRALPPGTSLPPYRVEPRAQRVWSVPPPQDATSERVETWSLPDGGLGQSEPPGEPPRSADEARLACTLLARELGRQLSARHGIDLRSDLDGLEAAQRYLREALVDGRVRTSEEHAEVKRHGGFLSELLARRLGARWVDLDSAEAGRWAMLVPSRSRSDEVARIWPFARVLRFVAMGHRERDLVSYYLELEARAR